MGRNRRKEGDGNERLKDREVERGKLENVREREREKKNREQKTGTQRERER